jgi:hypothetical protein
VTEAEIRRDGIATGLSRALVALEARGLHEAAGVVRELLEATVDAATAVSVPPETGKP